MSLKVKVCNKNCLISRTVYTGEDGFEIYCNVSRISTTTIKDNSVITPRFNIDGFTFFRAKESVDERFFDVNKVIDNSRPTLK